jgi:hypothetical protein
MDSRIFLFVCLILISFSLDVSLKRDGAIEDEKEKIVVGEIVHSENYDHIELTARTRVPTFSPTGSELPTYSPTAVPTLSPTKQKTNILYVVANFTFENVTASFLSLNDQHTIQLSIAEVLNISSSNVNITSSALITGNRRRLFGPETIPTLSFLRSITPITTTTTASYHRLTVYSQIIYNLVNYPERNISSLMEMVSTQLNSAVESGSFTDSVTSLAIKQTATDLYNCSITEVALSFSVGYPYVRKPYELTTPAIISIVFCSIVGFFLLLAALFMAFTEQKHNGNALLGNYARV